MFPRLTDLEVDASISASLNVMAFLTPSLLNLSIYQEDLQTADSQSVATSLSTFAWKTPFIRKFRVVNGVELPPNAFVELMSFQKLRSISIDYCTAIDYKLMEGLATLEDLEDLHLILEPGSQLLVMPNVIQHGFRRLQELSISGRRPLLSQILSMISEDVGVLHTLSFTYQTPMQVSQVAREIRDYTNFHATIARFLSIKSLTISLPEFDEVLPEIWWEHITSIFSPFYGLRNLEVLTYTGPLFLADDDVAQLALSLPRLRSLHLPVLTAQMLGSVPTYLALASLARHCVDLHSLHIAIALDTPPDVLDTPISKSRLNSLITTGPIINHNRVARLLDGLFPFIHHFWAQGATEDGKRVEAIILDVCQPIRRDQRFHGADC